MSLYIFRTFLGQKVTLSSEFFEKFLECRLSTLDTVNDSRVITAFRLGNFGFTHTQKVIGDEPGALLFRQRPQAFVEQFPHVALLQDFLRERPLCRELPDLVH